MATAKAGNALTAGYRRLPPQGYFRALGGTEFITQKMNLQSESRRKRRWGDEPSERVKEKEKTGGLWRIPYGDAIDHITELLL